MWATSIQILLSSSAQRGQHDTSSTSFIQLNLEFFLTQLIPNINNNTNEEARQGSHQCYNAGIRLGSAQSFPAGELFFIDPSREEKWKLRKFGFYGTSTTCWI